MIQKLLKEPVVAGVVTRVLAMVGARYGVHLSMDELLAVMVALEVVLGVLVRGKVQPSAKASQAPLAG